MIPSVVLVQLGCEKNAVDGERILGELRGGGYEFLTLDSDGFRSMDGAARDRADLLIVNTCAFIGPARDESVDAILEAAEMKRSGRIGRLGVAGCFAKSLHDELTDSLRRSIDFFMGPGDIDRALAIIDGERPYFRPDARSLDPGPRFLSRGNRVAYVKIAEGCDKNCSFCTIPSFKGRFVSRPMKAILEEISAFARLGIREIVLVSQDTVSWGREFGSDLIELIKRVDALADADRELLRDLRVRIHYLYPSQVTKSLVAAMIASPVVVNYFDIPVQHASPRVLRAMNRPPYPDALAALVRLIRESASESAVRTTVIAGHPGETNADFEMLMNWISDVEFDRLGVFAYSREPGTRAASMRGRAPAAMARARSEELLAAQAEISRNRLSARIGRKYRILMDAPGLGRSEFEAPDVDGRVYVEGETGEFVDAVITGSDEHDLFASRVMVT